MFIATSLSSETRFFHNGISKQGECCTFHSVSVLCILLHVKFHLVNWTITSTCSVVRTDTQLYVVSGGSWQGLGEVWRIVELTAATDAVLTIPQWVIRIEYELISPWRIDTT